MHHDRLVIDRRAFVGLAGTSVALSFAGLPVALGAAPSFEPIEQPVYLTDWTIDDMWGVYPRPAEAIGFGRPATTAEPEIDPVDLPFVA
jgi:hypothetical protein